MPVVTDIIACDQLTLPSLPVAVAVNLIVNLMALAGKHALDNDEQVCNRIRQEAVRRIQGLLIDDYDE